MLNKEQKYFNVQSAHVKQELKLLEIEQLPGAIETSQISDSENLKYVFTAKAHSLGGEGAKTSQVLAVTFFNIKVSIPEFRMFFNTKNFVTERIVPERKWSNATLNRLISYWQGEKVAACADRRSAKLICDFFKSEELPYKAIEDWQNSLRDSQRATRHKKETDRIDERMKECRELPKDFDHWINEVVLDYSRYIYYKRSTKRKIECYCTSCKYGWVETGTAKEPPMDAARHGEQGKCPMCKKAITYKATGKTTKHVDETVAAYAQKTKDGIVLRYFRVTKKYNDHYRSPKLWYGEIVRDYYKIESAKKWNVEGYEWDVFKQRGPMRWCPSNGKHKVHPACLYTRNLHHVFAETPWKYSAIYDLAKNLNSFNVWGYMRVYCQNPMFEYLVKLRLYRIVAEDVDNLLSGWRQSNLNLEGKSAAAVLKIDTASIRQLQRLNGDFEYLRMLRSAYEAGVALKDGQVRQFVDMGIDTGAAQTLLKYATPKKITNYAVQIYKDKRLRQYADERSPKSRMQQLTSYWADYSTNCQLLGYDMKNDFILFPRDLKTRHDEVVELYKAEESELQDKAIREMFQELQGKFGFSYKGLIVKPPTCTDEVIAEGHTLRHCVSSGSYITNITKGKGYIFFVRQESAPDEPFFTAEVADGVVKQCRGYKNCSMTDEIKKFVAQWQKKKLAPT